MTLQFDGVEDLPEFPTERARAEMEPEPRQLHRDRGGAGAWLAGAHEVPGGPDERHWVHAGMLREIFVLETDRRVDERWRDFVEWSPDPVFLIAGERDAKHVAVAVAHAGGEVDLIEQRRFGEKEPGGGDEDGDSGNGTQPISDTGYRKPERKKGSPPSVE